MTQAELLLLVLRLAADRGFWEPHLELDPGERRFALLRRDEEVEVYLVGWMDGHDTGFHDHDDAAAAIVVLDGEVREERLGLEGASGRDYAAGEAVAIPPSAIHRVCHAGTRPAATLHAYSPPLRRMGRYAVGPDGVLERLAQDAGTRLEPVA